MSVTTGGSSRSPAAAARRAQIIDATIAVVAAEGFGQASYARITERAGLSSTRLISYHFAGKDELVLAVVQHIVAGITASVGARVRAEGTAAGQLRAFIEGTVAYADEQRAPMSALLKILLAGALPQGAGADDPVPHHLVALLRQGQVDGEFRDFDPRAMAMAVQRSVESVSFLLQSDPDLDCAAFGRELATLFDLATRRPS